jgi:hypothetical protein
LTFTWSGNAGSGAGHNFGNAAFSGAYAAQMNTLINPLSLSLKGATPDFSGTLSGLVVGNDYRLRLISYDGDSSINDPTDRGNWTFTAGADSTTVNAWSALGVPNGTHINTAGSYFQYQFVATATSINWSLGADDTGKFALLTALTLEALPEPNTVALMGLGGLLMVIRRRSS